MTDSTSETDYLLRSPKNAQRLLAAIKRSQARDVQPVAYKSTELTITELKQELDTQTEEDQATGLTRS
jgi:hypothetical protein